MYLFLKGKCMCCKNAENWKKLSRLKNRKDRKQPHSRLDHTMYLFKYTPELLRPLTYEYSLSRVTEHTLLLWFSQVSGEIQCAFTSCGNWKLNTWLAVNATGTIEQKVPMSFHERIQDKYIWNKYYWHWSLQEWHLDY